LQIDPASQSANSPLKLGYISYLLFFVSAFWGPALGGIPLGPFSLFPARIFALAAWGFLALALVCRRSSLAVTRPLLPRYWPETFLAFWLLWGVFSLLWAIDPLRGARDLFNLFIGLSLVGLAPLFLNSQKRLNRAAWIWLATLGVFLAMGAYEHVTTMHLPVSRFSHGLQPHLAYRPTGVFVNENNYAVFISLSIPFLLAAFRHFNKTWTRIVLGLGLFAALYLLFVTGSRINFLVLMASVLVFSFFLTSRGKRLKVFALLMVLIVGTWFLFGVTQPSIRGYVARQLGKIIVPGNYFEGGQSIALRVKMARNSLHFLLRTFGFGVGAGNFEAWIVRGAPFDTLDIENPHNWWLELASEYGLLIFLGYLAFFAFLLWSTWRSWKETRGRDKWLPEALSLCLAIFPLVAISPNSFLDYLPHWLILSLAFAWQRYSTKGSESQCAS
jgi:teichuronic acid biosynthesis protein TuaE